LLLVHLLWKPSVFLLGQEFCFVLTGHHSHLFEQQLWLTSIKQNSHPNKNTHGSNNK
jgi:hypothetical protein